MPTAYIQRPKDVAFSLLHGAKPAGRSIGEYAGQAIAEIVEDAFGHRLMYAGVAPRRLDGEFDVDALQPGEFILKPGLVYRRVPS